MPAVLSTEAEADLAEAAAWLERQGEGLGVALVAEVRATLARLGDQPEAHPEVRPGVRRAQVSRFSYGLFYRYHAGRVEVAGVFHDRRSPQVWQRRVRG